MDSHPNWRFSLEKDRRTDRPVTDFEEPESFQAMIDWIEILSTLTASEIIDLLLVTAMVFAAIVWLRGSRARFACGGVLVMTALYFLSRQFGLYLTSWVLQGFMAISVLLIIVVFDEDLKRLFERLSTALISNRSTSRTDDLNDTLTRALCRLAGKNHGALIVMPGREPLDRHLEGGVPLEGRVSELLLLSLFDPHSPGHDGAVLVEGERLVRFSIHLPLSSDHAKLDGRGTRHAAALGLAERSDALCLVVSEERGEISVACARSLRTLARPELVSGEIEQFFQSTAAWGDASTPRWRRAVRCWREAVMAVGVTLALWLVAVPGSGGADIDRSVPVHVYDLPEGYELLGVDPPEITVTLHGRRRDLIWQDGTGIETAVHAYLVEQGRRTFTVDTKLVSHPPELEVVAVYPRTVKINVQRRPPKPGGNP